MNKDAIHPLGYGFMIGIIVVLLLNIVLNAMGIKGIERLVSLCCSTILGIAITMLAILIMEEIKGRMH